MVVISVPGQEVWSVANWGFRMLAATVSPLLTDEADEYTIKQAGLLGGLHFDLVDPAQRRRLAVALESAAIELRAQLIAGPQDDPRDAMFAEILPDLVVLLRSVPE